MTFNLFSALNLGLGLGLFIVGCMALYHRHKGFRFNPQQERTALVRLGWALGLIGFSYAFSGVLGTLIDVASLNVSIPYLAAVPLLARVVGGLFLWELIRWTLYCFYPTQQR